MKSFSKVKFAFGIAIVFLLVLMTNLADREHIRTMRGTVEAIYSDRLVAKDFLYKLSREISLRELHLARRADQNVALAPFPPRGKIDQLLANFAETKLTKQEAIVFAKLEQSIDALEWEEAQQTAAGAVAPTALLERYAKTRRYLDELSAIQMEEGRSQLYVSDRALGFVELFTQIEIIALIFFGLLLQFIIIYNPKPDEEMEDV